MSQKTKTTKNSWFSIKAMGEEEHPHAEIHIYDEIGYWGITARQFINQIQALDVEEISLRINSPGGEVFDGTAIYNALKQHKARVVTHIDGLAASMGSIIALAGDEVHIADNAYVMIHNPVSIAWGDQDDMLKEAEILDKIEQGLASIYSSKMGMPVEEVRDLMKAETWWVGQEAVDAGFADTTYEGTRAAASFDVKRRSSKAPKEVLERFSKQTPPQSSGTKPPKSQLSMTEEEIQAMKAENERLKTAKTEADNKLAAANDEKTAAVEAAKKEATARVTGINALGAKFGFETEAQQFAKDGKSVEEFQAHILAKSPDDWKDSLSIKNPSNKGGGNDEEDEEDEGKQAVALIKKRRKQ